MQCPSELPAEPFWGGYPSKTLEPQHRDPRIAAFARPLRSSPGASHPRPLAGEERLQRRLRRPRPRLLRVQRAGSRKAPRHASRRPHLDMPMQSDFRRLRSMRTRAHGPSTFETEAPTAETRISRLVFGPKRSKTWPNGVFSHRCRATSVVCTVSPCGALGTVSHSASCRPAAS